VAIEVTNKCNLACKICQSRGSRPQGFMDRDLFLKVIIQANEMNVPRVGLFLGGEPLLHPNFVQFMQIACAKIPEVVYFTNGSFLDEEVIQESVNFGVNTINISLDGVRDCHERMRPGSDYQRVKKNIERLLDIRGKNKHPIVSVNMMLCDQTEKEVQDFIDEWAGKVDYAGISVSKPSSFQRDYEHPFWHESETYNVSYCRSPYYYMAVMWDGRVIPCCDVTGSEIVGDLNQESLQDIWYGDKMKAIRKREANTCKECNIWQKSFVTKREDGIEYNDIYKNYIKV